MRISHVMVAAWHDIAWFWVTGMIVRWLYTMYKWKFVNKQNYLHDDSLLNAFLFVLIFARSITQRTASREHQTILGKSAALFAHISIVIFFAIFLNALNGFIGFLHSLSRLLLALSHPLIHRWLVFVWNNNAPSMQSSHNFSNFILIENINSHRKRQASESTRCFRIFIVTEATESAFNCGGFCVTSYFFLSLFFGTFVPSLKTRSVLQHIYHVHRFKTTNVIPEHITRVALTVYYVFFPTR